MNYTVVILTGAAVTVGTTTVVAGDVSADSEVVRLQAHFDRVLERLDSREVPHLTSSQLDARKRMIRSLRRYRDRGQFPRNINHDDRVPIFVDHDGTQCAVGYLMAEDGRTALVDRIADERNAALVGELATEPEVQQWLGSVGLSEFEAAQIQPGYDPPPLTEFSTWYSSAGVGRVGVESGHTIDEANWAGVRLSTPQNVRLTYVAAHLLTTDGFGWIAVFPVDPSTGFPPSPPSLEDAVYVGQVYTFGPSQLVGDALLADQEVQLPGGDWAIIAGMSSLGIGAMATNSDIAQQALAAPEFLETGLPPRYIAASVSSGAWRELPESTAMYLEFRATTCGDNRVMRGETCDDGNTEAGDGCSPTCRPEPAIQAAAPPMEGAYADGHSLALDGADDVDEAGCQTHDAPAVLFVLFIVAAARRTAALRSSPERLYP